MAEEKKATFRPKLRDITGAEFAGRAQQQFEASVVDYIVGGFGRYATDMRYVLRNRARQAGPDHWPTFFDFYEEFFDDRPLPVYLFVRQLPKIREKVTLLSLLQAFEKTPVADEYTSLADEVPSSWSGPVGLAFFYPFLKEKTRNGGALVLHNDEQDPEIAGFYASCQLADGTRLWLEPLSRLIRSWSCRGFFNE